MTDTTIYARNSDAWQRIERAGFLNLAEMARRMTSPSIMDDAIGYKSATSKWSRGKGMPSPDAERRAKAWMDNRDKNDSERATPTPNLLLITCPASVVAKVHRVLTLLGCEVIEV